MSLFCLAVADRPQSLKRWIWRAFFRTALVPLLLVEVVFIGIYIGANAMATRENIAAVERVAEDQLAHISSGVSATLDAELRAVRRKVEVLAAQAMQVMNVPVFPGEVSPAERARYATSPDGVTHTTEPGAAGAALFFSSTSPMTAERWEQVWRSTRLDPLMRALQREPLVMQVYFNTWDSMNRIYPYFDAYAQYPPDMQIPEFSFYYLADDTQNPSRKAVWTEVYVDPAGGGWMTSAVAPVYIEDRLLGVVGLDVTVDLLVEQVLALDIPWEGYGMLVGRDSTILALPPNGEQDWGLKELLEFDYQEQIRADSFKPDAFKLTRHPEGAAVAEAVTAAPEGIAQVQLNGAAKLVAWSTQPETGWRLLVVVPEAGVHAEAQALGARIGSIAVLMGVGLVCFYAVYFLVLRGRARRMAHTLAVPLRGIVSATEVIGDGGQPIEPQAVGIREIDTTSHSVIGLGERLHCQGAALQDTNRRLVVAKREAEAASVAKSEFLARMGHELRSPLSASLTTAELLERSQLTPAQQVQVAGILHSGRMLLNLLDQVFDYSLLEAGWLHLKRQPHALEAVVVDVARLFQGEAAQRGIELILEVDPAIPLTVQGDPVRLRQVLSNLMGNSIKFTESGHVRLSAKLEAHDGEAATVRFAVEDTGCGIAAQDQSRIFELFTQVDGGPDRKHGGVGLGLAIVDELVTLMGGSIEVESAEALGTCISFRLRFDVCGPLRPVHNWDLRQVRALVAHSNPDRCRLIGEYLRAFGAEVDLTPGPEQPGSNKGERTLVRVVEWSPKVGQSELVDAESVVWVQPLLQAAGMPSGPGEWLQEPFGPRDLVRAVRAALGLESDHNWVDPVAAVTQAVPPMAVLVVEDGALSRSVLAEMLRQFGCTVWACGSGDAALPLWLAHPVDLVLVDVHMPGRSGNAVVREIRRQEAALSRPRTRVYAVSADTLDRTRDDALAAGFDRYFIKPVGLVQLRAILQEIATDAAPTDAAGQQASCT